MAAVPGGGVRRRPQNWAARLVGGRPRQAGPSGPRPTPARDPLLQARPLVWPAKPPAWPTAPRFELPHRHVPCRLAAGDKIPILTKSS